MQPSKPLQLAITAALLGLAAPAHAGSNWAGPNLVGMGEAGVAAPGDNAGITVNPGTLGLSERYDVAAQFNLGPTPRYGWTASAVDARTGRLAMGVSWRRAIDDPPLTLDDMPGWITPGHTPSNLQKSHQLSLALAYPLDDERRWSVGLGGTLQHMTQERQGTQITFDGDVGVGFRANDLVTLGLVASHVVPLAGQTDLPLSVSTGLWVEEIGVGAFALDLGWQLEDPQGLGLLLNSGFELHLGPVRPRLGYSFDGPDNQHRLHGGMGVFSDTGGLEYGVSIPLGSPSTVRGMVHTVGIRLRT